VYKKIPKIKHAEKMVKIRQMGFLKLTFETIPKTHFPVYAKKILQDNFQILGPLGCQGNVKKGKITAS
jgi:hypothetical protein